MLCFCVHKSVVLCVYMCWRRVFFVCVSFVLLMCVFVYCFCVGCCVVLFVVVFVCDCVVLCVFLCVVVCVCV